MPNKQNLNLLCAFSYWKPCVCERERKGERKRGRQKEREREREREREKEREKERDRETERQRETERHSETETQRDTERQRDREGFFRIPLSLSIYLSLPEFCLSSFSLCNSPNICYVHMFVLNLYSHDFQKLDQTTLMLPLAQCLFQFSNDGGL